VTLIVGHVSHFPVAAGFGVTEVPVIWILLLELVVLVEGGRGEVACGVKGHIDYNC